MTIRLLLSILSLSKIQSEWSTEVIKIVFYQKYMLLVVTLIQDFKLTGRQYMNLIIIFITDIDSDSA